MTNHLTPDGEYALAEELAQSFAEMIDSLTLRARKLAITPEQIAEHLDWSADDVLEVESPFGDPSLSMVQDYARATGARITIEVTHFAPKSQSIVSAGSLRRTVATEHKPAVTWTESPGTRLVLH